MCRLEATGGFFYSGAETGVHQPQHAKELCTGMMLVYFFQQCYVGSAELLISLRDFPGLTGIVGSQMNHDQVWLEKAVIPWLPLLLWLAEVLLFAAGISIVVEHGN